MFYNRVVFIAIVFLTFTTSCYHKEYHYSFNPSNGGAISGSSYYYLARVSEFQRPKGISTFPDGGMSKDIRQFFGLFKTDTLSSSTILITRLGEVDGWPTRYATRLEKNDSYIALGIVNVTSPDSVSGIYLYNINRSKLIKYNKENALPTFSQNGLLMAYCILNRLVIDDYTSKTTLFSYLLNFEPAYVTWKSNSELYLFFANPFSVKVLNISTGETTNSDLKYIKNYDQEISITQINRILKWSPKNIKDILDKYY